MNLEKKESKLTISKRRVLITNLVMEAKNLALADNKIRVDYFYCTELLMDYAKSDTNNKIKL